MFGLGTTLKSVIRYDGVEMADLNRFLVLEG
jgi:hypothetical protein